MKFDADLNELRALLSVELPMCSAHSDRVAAAFCGRCGRGVCKSCLSVTPVEPRCPGCRGVSDRLPSSGAWLAGFAGAMLQRRWGAAFAAAAAVFLGIALLLPGLLRPAAPKAPKAVRSAHFKAPFLEKSFRLASVGDMYAVDSMTEAATARYRRAIAACEKHLEGEKDPHRTLQVRLGIGRLLRKAGDIDAAILTFQKVKTDGAAEPAAGVADYYMGMLYESDAKDKTKALACYREAFRRAGPAADPLSGLDKLLEYDADEGAGGRSVFAVAALTDTLTSASGASAEIAEAIERLSGEKPGGGEEAWPSPEPRDKEPPEPLDSDPLIIIKGV